MKKLDVIAKEKLCDDCGHIFNTKKSISSSVCDDCLKIANDVLGGENIGGASRKSKDVEIDRLKQELKVKDRALELACKDVPNGKSSLISIEYKKKFYYSKAEKMVQEESNGDTNNSSA
jgi:hypothetical protein